MVADATEAGELKRKSEEEKDDEKRKRQKVENDYRRKYPDTSCNECARSDNLAKIESDFQGDWDGTTCRIAAENGQLDILKYLHENGCPWDEDAILAAAKNGWFECLMYLHKEKCEVVDSSVWCEDIVRNGNLGILEYCVRNNIISLTAKERQEDFCMIAAERGHLKCIEYLHDKCNVPWDEQNLFDSFYEWSFRVSQIFTRKGVSVGRNDDKIRS